MLRALDRRVLPWMIAAAALAWVSTRAVLRATGGEPAVPLDDAYIHFQYARAFLGGHPFTYTPGAAPTPGATSLVWPLLLAPFTAFLFRDTAVIWVTWAIGFVALGGLAYETKRLAEGICTPLSSVAAGIMVLAFGGYSWFAASGMELVPFAWLLARTARRASEWVEGTESESRAFVELAVLAWVCPVMRPEGVIATLSVGAALLLRPHRGRRTWSLCAFAAVFGPASVYWIGTGTAVSTTAAAKWLVFNPYYRGSALWGAVLYNVELFFMTLLDGQLWTSIFLPPGGRAVAWIALPALLWTARETRGFPRAGFVAVVALAALLPTTYETFLVNRVRYIWPFAFAWFIGLAIVGDAVGALSSRIDARLGDLRLLANGAFIGFLASHLGVSIDDLAESAAAITLQQAALGKWIAQSLPRESIVGVNDAGAIAYFGRRRTFDVVGLTTKDEARYWVAGPASRFEHYEHLAAQSRPTHFVVYPEWFGIDVLLGDQLTERTVAATILGGQTMVARRARYDALGSGAEPLLVQQRGRKMDELDVADLESEAAHAYDLFGATQQQNIVVQRDDVTADGARSGRVMDSFSLLVGPSSTVVARCAATEDTRVAAYVGGIKAGELLIPAQVWSELEIRMPSTVRRGRQPFQIRALGNGQFTSMHYWSYE